jgi:SAM-dependent methyltransferase
MLKRLHKYYLHQLFDPNWFSIFINPFYFIRKNLKKGIAEFASNLNGKVLDVGCGLKPYKSLFTNASSYTGIDIENPGHDHSKEEIDCYYDGRNIPFANASYDGAFCSEVLEHVFEPEPFIKEISRVIKPEGLLLLTVPFVWNEHEMPYDFGRYTSGGLKELIMRNGFTVISTKKTGHFTLVIMELIMLYIHNRIFTGNKYINLLINFIFISPFTLLGGIFSFFLPRDKSLYFNTIILAKRGKQ